MTNPIQLNPPSFSYKGLSGHIFHCIDAHTCGNPVRVVAHGGPALEGANMRERRLYFLEHYDWIRHALMFEPRGHDMMSGSILYPPADESNDVGVLFIETSGCLPMCGHGTIGTITIAIEEGLIKPKQPGTVKMETPAGLVTVTYGEENGKVKWVKLVNVPAFVAGENLATHCMALGNITVDVCYGGNFYAILDVQENFAGLEKYTAEQLVQMARELRKNINAVYQFVHPHDEAINGCSHILFCGATINPSSSARNAVFYGDKAIDRSPCGTGTSARMMQWYNKGLLKKGDEFIHESIIGSCFTGRVEEELTLDGKLSIRPSIEGWATITGYNTISVNEQADPYAKGFQVI